MFVLPMKNKFASSAGGQLSVLRLTMLPFFHMQRFFNSKKKLRQDTGFI
jgi:hypothetical protein